MIIWMEAKTFYKTDKSKMKEQNERMKVHHQMYLILNMSCSEMRDFIGWRALVNTVSALKPRLLPNVNTPVCMKSPSDPRLIPPSRTWTSIAPAKTPCRPSPLTSDAPRRESAAADVGTLSPSRWLVCFLTFPVAPASSRCWTMKCHCHIVSSVPLQIPPAPFLFVRPRFSQSRTVWS